MAASILNRTGCWWAAPGVQNSWNSSSSVQSGTPSQGGNYRSKIAFSTAGLTIGKSQKLVVEITLSNNSFPQRCKGVLSANGDIEYNDVQNSACTDMSDTLNASAIATSVSYKDADGASAYTGDSSVASGKKFYFIFDTDGIEADKTYYVYVIQTAKSNSWVKGTASSVVATLTYDDYYCVRIGNGNGHDKHAVYIHDGTSFVKYRPYIHDGTDWQPYDG